MAEQPKYHCPRDGLLLEKGRFSGVALYRCGDCGGVLVPRPNLLGLLIALSFELLYTIRPDHPIDRVYDKGGGLGCPSCGHTMEHYGYMGSNRVKIDGCRRCGLVWTDPAELGAMALLYARTNKRGEHKRMSLEQWQSESGRGPDIGPLAGGILLDKFVSGGLF